jgi:hypothetical protein
MTNEEITEVSVLLDWLERYIKELHRRSHQGVMRLEDGVASDAIKSINRIKVILGVK